MSLHYLPQNLTYFPRKRVVILQDVCYPIKKDIDITAFHSFFYKENERDFYFKDIAFNSWRIIYVDHGEVSVTADNTGYILRQGDMIFHEPGESHALASNGKDLNSILVINFDASGDGMEKFRNKVYALNPYQQDLLKYVVNESGYAFTVKKQMLVLNDPPEMYGSFQLTASLLERLFIDLIRWGKEYSESRRSGGARKNIELVLSQSVVDYMERHIGEKLTLQDICNRFHVGKSYLSQAFRAQTDRSVMDYFISLKIEKAKEILEEGRMNVTQVSESLGFSSVHHFTRSFKNHTGYSPSGYGKKK